MGPLTTCQRLRALICIFVWILGTILVAAQAPLTLCPQLGKRRPPKLAFEIAEVSFWAETFCLSLVFALPAVAGFDMLTSSVIPLPTEWAFANSVIQNVFEHGVQG